LNLAQTLDDAVEDRDRDARVLDQERVEIDRLDHQGFHRHRRLDARGTARVAEQRHLAEEVAGREVVDGTADLDLRGTGQDHEKAAAIGVALDERLAGRVAASLADHGDAREIDVGQLLEEADLAKGLDIARHVISPGRLSSSSLFIGLSS
jgi:hypothetical protein